MTAKLLIIAGATASGKTDLSLRLAGTAIFAEQPNEILSVDSVQVYRGLDIGSAKPSRRELDSVPHHLIDISDPDKPLNAATFSKIAESSIAEINARHSQPILVVGTTLYLKSLLYGLAAAPETDATLRAELEQRDLPSLYAELSELDSERAKELHPNDKLRIIRALEIYKLGKKGNLAFYSEHSKVAKYSAVILLLHWPRELLHKRIEQRSIEIVRRGILKETKDLIERFGENNNWLKSIGYAQAFSVIRGEISEAELTEKIIFATRQLAKRQLTFWRNEPAKLGWNVLPQDQGIITIEKLRAKMRECSSSGITVWNLDAPTLLKK